MLKTKTIADINKPLEYNFFFGFFQILRTMDAMIKKIPANIENIHNNVANISIIIIPHFPLLFSYYTENNRYIQQFLPSV